MKLKHLFALLFISYIYASDVIDLNGATFRKEVLDSNTPWLVAFYSPHCGHCIRLMPTWEKVATSLKKVGIPVGKVDVSKEQQLSGRYQIQGVPSIKMFMPREKEPTDYNGPRSAGQITDFILSSHPGGNLITTITTPQHLDAFLRLDETLPHMLFVSTKSSPPPILKQLALLHKHSGKNGVKVGLISGTSWNRNQKMFASKLGINADATQSLPRLIMVSTASSGSSSSSSSLIYPGEFNFVELNKFFKAHSQKESSNNGQQKSRARTHAHSTGNGHAQSEANSYSSEDGSSSYSYSESSPNTHSSASKETKPGTNLPQQEKPFEFAPLFSEEGNNNWESKCLESKICAIFNIPDKNGEEHVKFLSQFLKSKYSHDNFVNWFYVTPKEYSKIPSNSISKLLEENKNVPSCIALKPKRERASVWAKENILRMEEGNVEVPIGMEWEGINTFLERLVGGESSFKRIDL